MRIVALVPGGIGEQILFFPTLDDLKQNYPDAEIDVVVEPRSIGAYRVCASVSDVIRFDFKDRNSLADWGNILGVIRDREYDIALSLEQTRSVGLLLWLSGIPVRVGFSGNGKIYLTNTVPLKTEQYAACMHHDLLRGLGITSPCPEVTINVPKQDIQWAEAEKARLGIAESAYVVIYGSSPSADKRADSVYPVENWRQIIQDFRQRQPDLPVVLVIDPEDRLWASQLLRSFPDIKVTTPEDLGKLAAIVAGASLMLCTEGAPMHLAVAVQTYTLALFGSADSNKLLPKSDRFLAIKSPTGKLADIPPSTVLERVWAG